MRRLLAAVVLALAVAVAAAAVVALTGGQDRGATAGAPGSGGTSSGTERPAAPGAPAPTPGRGADAASPAPVPTPTAPVAVMVRRAGGVPATWRHGLGRVRGVGTVTAVARAQALLRRTTAAGGGRARPVRAGYAVVLDTLVVEPRRYAAMLPAAEARLVRRLRPGTALLSRRSARLRRAGRGSTLALAGGHRLRIAGVLDDAPALATELVVSAPEGRRLGIGPAFLVAAVEGDRAIERVADAFDRPRTAVAVLGRPPWPVRRRIASTAELKERFG
ncbi:MAG: hypothetical protein QOJ21_1657, partial [Solirubrobacteraceae bacterium]|nr:hypothetical protein [Solirubrobacteraceae bacterium]